jgi:hypothetical protein
MITSLLGSFAVNLFDLILFGESKDYRAFFGQIFPVIGDSRGSIKVFIESSDFVFVESESNPTWT